MYGDAQSMRLADGRRKLLIGSSMYYTRRSIYDVCIIRGAL